MSNTTPRRILSVIFDLIAAAVLLCAFWSLGYDLSWGLVGFVVLLQVGIRATIAAVDLGKEPS